MNSQNSRSRFAIYASVALLTFVFALPGTAQAQQKSLYRTVQGLTPTKNGITPISAKFLPQIIATHR